MSTGTRDGGARLVGSLLALGVMLVIAFAFGLAIAAVLWVLGLIPELRP